MGDLSEHFSKSEFACKCGCGFDAVSPAFIKRLEQVRTLYGKPIKVHSGCRCKKHNEEEGGKDDSSHLYGEAGDLDTPNSTERYELLQFCLLYFNRVGVGKTFIHVDIDKAKPQDVCWVY